MKNKLGGSLGLQVIIVLIIAVGFALIYFMWLKDYRTFAEDLTDYTICKNSNFENAKTKLKIDNQVIAEKKGNKCRTEYLTVPKGQDEDQELKFIARKLAGCWDQYLEGREDLFYTEDNTFCAICSVLYFDDDEKEITDLISYLMNNEVPTKPGKSYFQYISRIRLTDGQLQEVEDAQRDKKLGTVDTGTPQSIIFVEGKDVNPGSLTGYSSTVSGIAGFAIGATVTAVVAVAATVCTLSLVCAAGVTGAAIVVGTAGGGAGYFLGSDDNPDLDSRVLLWPYNNEDLKQLKCTVLEGQDRLEIRKFDDKQKVT